MRGDNLRGNDGKWLSLNVIGNPRCTQKKGTFEGFFVGEGYGGTMEMKLYENSVAVQFVRNRDYRLEPPFDPPEKYPELNASGINEENQIFEGVRTLFRMLKLDEANFGTSNWNPFKDIIKPGMTVFLKPNTVRHFHLDGKDVLSVIVDASVLRPILDYTCIALKNRGRIIVADSQVIFGRFAPAYKAARIDALLDWYRTRTDIPIECFDLRLVEGHRTYMWGKWGRRSVAKDPKGYTFVDLEDLSAFRDVDPKRLRIAIASHKNMYKHHSGGKHEYLIPNSFLQSDVVINIPKFKTHRRTAITLAQKNLFGIPAWKDTMPHFTTGSVIEGGDQYINPSWRKRIGTWMHDIIQSSPYVPIKFAFAVLKKILWNTHKIIPFKDDVFEAMWHGNDTLWRTLVDINRIAFYADREGTICDTPQRAHFCLVDGIIGGERNGPVSPDPVPLGLLMAGHNAAAMDAVGATLMGFDIRKIPVVSKAIETRNDRCPLFKGAIDDIWVFDTDHAYTLMETPKYRNLHFEPHPGWKGNIELEESDATPVTMNSTT